MASSAMSGHTTPLGINSTGIRYPSPFFDIASTYLPRNSKELMQWYKYYSVYDDIAASTIERLASFPVTKVIFDVEDKPSRERYRRLFEDQLNLKSFAREIGLDYFTFGNAFISIIYPFQRFLECSLCGGLQSIRKAKYKWEKMHFVGECPKCKADHVELKIRDWYYKKKNGIKLRRWDPERIDIQSSEGSGEARYYYTVSAEEAAAIKRGDRFHLETVPRAFIDSVRMSAPIRMDLNNVYHFKRPTRSDGRNGAWGGSVLAGVLKKLFYKQVLLKAQEQLAHQHIVPLWVFFPAANANLNPFTDLNLGHWRARVEQEIRKWRRDPNYIPVFPIPLGHEVIGGSQSAANIAPQVEAVNKDIIAGMGIAQGIVYGEMSYSGAAVSVRLEENNFASYQHELIRVLEHFVVRNICRFLRWKPPRIRMQTLKMADDVQQKAAMAQLQERGVISRRMLCEAFDIDYDEDSKNRENELVEQGKEQVSQMKAQAKAQAAYQEALQHATMRQQLRMKKLQQEIMEELAAEGMDPEAVQMQAEQIEQEGGFQQVGMDGQAQQAPGAQEQGGPGQAAGGAAANMGGMQVPDLVNALAQSIMQLPGDMQLQQLAQLDQNTPELGMAVRQAMQSGGGQSQTGTPKPGQVDMRPAPKQKPQRRLQAV
jgi:hypothetical protein